MHTTVTVMLISTSIDRSALMWKAEDQSRTSLSSRSLAKNMQRFVETYRDAQKDVVYSVRFTYLPRSSGSSLDYDTDRFKEYP